MDEIRRVIDPDGRAVVLDGRSWAHLNWRRAWLLDHVDVILATIALPYFRDDDERTAGRERFYARHPLLPARWLRVIVDYSEQPAWVVTAFVQHGNPQERCR